MPLVTVPEVKFRALFEAEIVPQNDAGIVLRRGGCQRAGDRGGAGCQCCPIPVRGSGVVRRVGVRMAGSPVRVGRIEVVRAAQRGGEHMVRGIPIPTAHARQRCIAAVELVGAGEVQRAADKQRRVGGQAKRAGLVGDGSRATRQGQAR